MLHHPHYFEAFDAVPDGVEPSHELMGGFIAVRLAHNLGGGGALPPNFALPPLLGHIEEMPVGSQIRHTLSRICDEFRAIIVREVRVEDTQLSTTLAAYARALESNSEWALALDAYETLIKVAERADDVDLAVYGVRRRAFCFRVLSRYEEAEQENERLSVMADKYGDEIGALDAQLARARIAADQGRVREADKLLQEISERARSKNLEGILGKAMIDLARTAGMAGDHETALRLSQEAHGLCTESREQDRALINIAYALMLLGEHRVARDTNLLLSVTAQEEEVRVVALIHLMELSGKLGLRVDFETYRRDLSERDFVPLLRAQYLESLARGYAALGETVRARVTWLELQPLAIKYGFTESQAEAEAALRPPLRIQPKPKPAQPELIGRVASSVNEKLALVHSV